MTKSITYIAVFTSLIGLSSCLGNQIHFDLNNQSIKSCNRKAIRHLYITNDSTYTTYHISHIDSHQYDILTILYIDSISEGYSIHKGFADIKIENSSFRLAPRSTYTISRAQGDAAPYEIRIATDEHGRVKSTDNETCSK